MNGYLNESATEPGSSGDNRLPGPGERLKKRRESLGLTLADVASYLNLRISIIEAIEENDYNHIPKLVFARGYLRSYAKLLNLPSNEIIDSFNQLKWPEMPSDIPAHPLKAGQKKAPKKGHSALPWIAFLIVVLLFLVAGFWQPITEILGKTKTTQDMPTAPTVSVSAKEQDGGVTISPEDSSSFSRDLR